jgi:hypothetical protein
MVFVVIIRKIREGINFLRRVPRLGASPRHGGAGRFFVIFRLCRNQWKIVLTLFSGCGNRCLIPHRRGILKKMR